MTVGITNIPIRSSPTCRSTLRRFVQLAYTHNTAGPHHTVAPVPMFDDANRRFEEGKARKAPLAKQLPPSSNHQHVNGDIRDQLKRPFTAAASQGVASASARTTQSFRDAITSRSSSQAPFGAGSLHKLYNNNNNNNTSSFHHEPNVVDLTGPEAQARAREAVYFAEEDFSDDADLDLEFEAPSALPILPNKPSTSIAKENLPPQSKSTQEDVNIPWSLSPAFHKLPPQRTTSEMSSVTERSLKRDSSGGQEQPEAPEPKKAKKRGRLPWPTNEEPLVVEDEDPVPTNFKTPSHNKSRDFLDPSASAVREQKRQLKNLMNQNQPAKPDGQVTEEQMMGAIKSHQKFAPISLSEEQRHVLDLVVNKNQSVFFTGPAGTGKSVLMRAIISDMKKKYAKDPERIAVTASTGLAACNIGGITLHSFSGIGLGKEDAPTLVKKIRRNQKAKNRWLRTKCLIIDEVSMVDGELFDKLSQIGRTIRNNGRPWGGIQLIITGDFFQLPPVPDSSGKRETKFAFDASTWATSIDHTIGLTQVFRQRDPEFARMLNEMRLGKISEDTVRAFKALSRPLSFDDGLGMAELFSTRAEVENSNERRLRDLPGKIYRFDAMDSGDPQIRDKLLANMMAPKSLELKLHAQVMLIKNLDETLVNGSLGKIIGFSDEKTFDITTGDGYGSDEDSMAKARRKLKGFSNDAEPSSGALKFPVVQFMATNGTQRIILCQPEDWKVELPNGEVQAKRTQLPLILAWALSIHKAQGQTLERVKVNLGRVFEKGQAYVALSRATSQDGLQVLGFDKWKVMAHPRVIAFYNKLYSVEEAMSKKPVSVADLITRKAPAAQSSRNGPEVVDLDDDMEAMASYGN